MVARLPNLKYLVFVLLFSLFSVRALFHPGLPPTHDGEYHVIRFYEFFLTLTNGSIYPRWAFDLNQGMGAPLFNFVYPLPNYFASITHLLGASFIDSFKLNLIAATITGSFSMYYFSRIYFKELGGIISSVFYTFAPYRFLDIFIRGSVGEVWAIAFFPALLWAITKLVQKDKAIYIGFSSLFLALLIFSHNILALMFFVFSLFYTVLIISKLKDKKTAFINTAISFALGLGLSAVFWFPALLEKKYVRGLDIFDPLQNFPEVYQLIIPSWGSGFSGGSISGQMSYQIGLINLLVIVMAVFFAFKSRKNISRVVVFFIASFFITLFFMLKASSPLWESLPFLHYFQFPWRLLSLEIFLSAFLAGFVWRELLAIKIHRRLKTFSLICLLVLPILLTLSYSKPAYYHQRDDDYYISRPNFINGTNSPGDSFNTIWTNDAKKGTSFSIVNGDGELSLEKKSQKDFIINTSSSGSISVLTNVIYFPGWKLESEKREYALIPNEDGRIQFVAGEGIHSFRLFLDSTRVQKLASIVTMISLGVILILFGKSLYTIYKR